MPTKYTFKKIIKVFCEKCDKYIDEDTVEFVNIEEDGIIPYDVLTFICPKCKIQNKSRRIG